MDSITWSLIIAGLGQGLVKALEKLLEKGVVDPALERGLGPLRSLITRGYDEVKDEEDLRHVLIDTLDELTQSNDIDQFANILFHIILLINSLLGFRSQPHPLM